MNKSKKQFQGRDYLTYSAFGAYSACTVALPLVLVELFKNIDFPLDTGNRGAAGFLQMALSIFMILLTIISSGLPLVISREVAKHQTNSPFK